MDSAMLPYGWITQVDPQTGQTFYVDTKANPPRSIWTHPYQDERFLNEHPDIREKRRGSNAFGSDASLAAPPPDLPQRHSFNGRPSTPVAVPPPPHKQGFFEKLKNKAITSMEERNERKRKEMLRLQQMQQQMYGQQAMSSYAAPRYGYPQPQYMGMMPRRRHGGMGGMALPMLGGLAGGMLLGDVLDNDGSGFGGGDDFGGDFGGF